jgi:hypothetical protein
MLGCGEVAWKRKYTVPIEIYVCHSPNANVNLTIEIPVDMVKKPDTKPNINPNLTVPLVPGAYHLEIQDGRLQTF